MCLEEHPASRDNLYLSLLNVSCSMSLIVRKPDFWMTQAGLYTVTVDYKRLEISDLGSREIILYL